MKQINFLSWRDVSTMSAMTVGSPSAHRRGTMLKLLSVLVLIFTFGIGQMWGGDKTGTLTMSSSQTSPVVNNGVTFTWTSSNIITGSGSGFKANSNMTITIPEGATLKSISKTNGNNWGSGATIYVYTGTNTSGTNIASIVTGTNTYNISSNNTGTTYYFANTTSKNAWINSLSVTYTEGASCSNNVSTSAKTAGQGQTNGSVSVGSTSSVATCSSTATDRQITVTVTPDAGFGAPTDLTTTGTASAPAKQSGPTNNNNGTYSYVYRFTQNTSGTCVFGASFVDQRKTVSWEVNGTPLTSGSQTTKVVSGSKVTTLPTAPVSNDCDGTKVFVGWTATENYSNASTPPTDLFITAAGAPTVTDNVTYYAVFATNATNATRVTATSGIVSGNYYVFVNDQKTNGVRILKKDLTVGAANTVPTESNNNITSFAECWLVCGNTTNGYTLTSSSNKIIGVNGTISGTSVTCGNYTTNSLWKFNTSTTNYLRIYNAGSTGYNIEYSGSNWIAYNSTSGDYVKMKVYKVNYTNYVTSCCQPLAQINGSVSCTSGTAATLSWSAVTGAESYKVKVPGSTSHNDWTTATSGVSVTGLTAGQNYTAYFKAFDSNGSHCTEGPESTTAFTTPQITVTGTPLAEMTYAQGDGPSGAESFVVKGKGLSGDNSGQLTVTAPTNFEVSLDNSTWGDSKTITKANAESNSGQTVYVRLKAGLLLANSPFGPSNVVISGGNAASVNVSVSGTVTSSCDVPSIGDATLDPGTTPNITASKIYVKCPTISAETNCDITAYGFIWEKGSAPTMSSKDGIEETGNNNQSSAYTDDLSIDVANNTGSTYYIKAYATNSVGDAVSSNALTVTPRKVTFSKNGHGTQSAPATQYMVDGGKATQPSALSDDNYDFGGWYDNADWTQGDAWDFANDVVSNGDQALYAKWTPKDYTITTTLNNVNISAAIASPYTYTGSAAGISRTFSVDADNFFMPEDIVVTMGDATLVKNTGYTYDSSNGAFELTATITGNVTITATATAKLKSIAITNQPTTRKYLVGDVFSSTGATVTATMGDGNTKTVSATWSPSTALSAGESQTVTASYTEAGINKTITTTIDVYSVTVNKVDMNGDDIDDANVTATCSGRTLSQSVGSTNYKFNSWQVSEGSVNVSTNTITGAPSGDVVINAKFHKPISIAWKVGTGNASTGITEVQYGTQMKDLTLPTDVEDDDLEDCGTNKFMGWSASELKGIGHDAPADLFTSATGATTITSDKTFYAVFAKNNASTVFEDDMSDGVTSRTGWSSFATCYSETGGGSSCVRMSSSSTGGVMTMSANANLTSPATITFKILHYGSEDGKVALSASKGTFSTTDFTASSGSSSWQEVSSTLTGCDKTSTITFTGTTKKRIYIKDISIVCGSTEDYQTGCCETLDAVSNVSVTPGRTSATVSWNKLANASGYEYKLGDAEWATASVANEDHPSISLSTLSGATSYAIQIRATGDGTTYCAEGTASAVTNFKTLSRVTAAVNDGARGAAKVSLNGEDWAASVDAADGTTIYLQATPSSASWTLGTWSASNGAVASSQLTGWTGDVTVTANFAAAELPTLATPTGMSSSAVTAISATISWNAVEHASSYAITCAGATQGDVTESAGVCSCTLTGLSAGTAYTWNVQAIGDNISYKSGAACADQNFTTVAKKPTAISITNPPTKTIYLEGDDFDATGLVVSVTYNTGESDGVYTTITPSTNLAAGTTKVTISATLNETTVSVDQAITVRTKYVLTFLNNGVEVSHKDLYEGAEYGTLQTLTSENACNATFTNFVGWTTDEITEQQSSKPTLVTATTTMSNADVTLNAVWSDFVPTDYTTTYTSNVTLPTENSSTDYYYVSKVTIGGVEYDGVKVGKSGNGGHFTINVPAGTKRLFVHGVCWYNEDNTLTITTAAEGVSISPSDAVALPRNSGMSGSSNNYTLASLDGTEYKTFTLTGVESTTTLTLTSSGRIDVFGIMASSSTGSGYYVTRCISSEVTIASLTHGSTITVKNGNATVTSGDEIAAGTALTITTDAASGYRVDNLRAYKTGDENTPVAITEGSLTMPIYGITITADETAVYPVSVAVAAGQSTWGSVTIDGEAGPAYVNEDDTPEMVATPNAGYRFKTWAVTTSGTYDLGEKGLTDASIAPQVTATATFTATFEEKPMTDLTLSQDALTVDLASGTASLSVTGYTPSDLLDAKKTIAWSSSDETVATVSNGTITLKKAGTATITAAWTEDESVNASCALNVYQWNFTGYEVTTAPETLYSNGDQFDKSSVVIKAGYERSDNSSTKQVTLDAAEWTAKLDGSVIANNYTFVLADNGKTLTLWVDETKVGEDYVLTVNAIPTDHFVINIWTSEISPIADKTSAYSMPNLSDQTAGAAATCKDHNLFVGWVEELYKDEPEGHIVAANTAMTPSNKTYYAVWGKTGTITESISYGWETGDIASNWSMSAKNAGLDATTGSARTGTYGGSMTSTGTYVKTLSRYATPKGITYYIRKQSGNTNTNNYFVLRYSSDNSNWTEIASTKYTFNNLSNTTWTEVTCDLSAETYQNKYFEIRMISGASGSLDDIEFSYTTSGAVDYITDCVQRYQVTFNANGGTGSYDAIEKKEGATVTLPDGSALSRAAEHYHFNGWKVYNASTEEEISVSENQFTMPGAAVNAVAQWEEDPKGTVRYIGDEILNSSITRYAGQTYDLRTEVTLPAGRKLVGWMLEGDETLYAPGRTMTMPDPVQNITYNVQVIDQLPTPSGVSFSDGEWVLVTNTNQLSAGDFVVIVANGLTNAMGTQANTNRGIASVTKHNEGQTITLTENVAKLFLQYGYREGEFALYDMAENGYLYASSNTSNDLKTSATYSNRNYSWLITIGEGNIASIVAKGANSHNNLKYNTSASVFSSYASGQAAIQLYRYDGHKTVEITENVNASAIYLDDADVVVKDGKTLTIDVASDLDNLTVEAGGKVSGSATLNVQDMTIESEPSKSGQVTSSDAHVNGDIYLEIKLLGDGTGTMTTEESQMWYCISAPFEVSFNDGFFWGNGTPMGHNVDFQAFVYDGAKRASNGTSGWQRAGGKMEAGKAYLIGFDDERSNQKTIRLKAMSNTIPTASSLPTEAHYNEDNAQANWNGVGNPTLHYIALDGFAGKVQCYNNGAGYSPYDPTTHNYVVGTALFMQADDNIDLKAATNENYRAPKRESEENESYSFCVEIAKEGATRCDNRLYVSTSDEATSTYEQGKDMQSMNGTSAKFAALIWTENYGMRLASEDVPMVNQKASYTLGVYAPKAGTYSISTVEASEDAELYLTYNGRAIWNLSMSECELELAQGQNAGYGLRLVVKAPAVVTGVDEINAESGVQKVIIDEHVYILRGGQMYDVNGKLVK